MSNERLAHELHIQSQQIDALLDHYELGAEVTSGEVHVSEGEKRSTFNIFGKLADGLEQARALKRDLQKALYTSQINLKEEQGRVQLNLFGQRAPVELLKVINAIDDIPPLTAVLGWSYDQRPILLDFKADETSHVLIAGSSRAGKTSLLRAIILSLALLNRERDLQLAVINARYNQTPQPYTHSGLRPFNYLPHLITPVIDNYDIAIETLQFLVEEIQYRSQNQIKTPHIIVLIDHLVDLVEVCGTAALLPLTHIIRNGAKSGVHLVLSTQRVEVAILQDIHDAYIPARFVGQVESARQAEIAADAYDTQAENLRGEGDFLAVVGQSLNHFQVAYVDDYDLHHCLERLHRSRPRPLLAHRFDPRPQLGDHEASAVYEAETENLFELAENSIEDVEDVVIESPINSVTLTSEFSAEEEKEEDGLINEQSTPEAGEDESLSNGNLLALQTTPLYTGYPTNYHTVAEDETPYENSIIETAPTESEENSNRLFEEEAATVPVAYTPIDQSTSEETIAVDDNHTNPEFTSVTPPQTTLFHQPLPPPAAPLDDLDEDELIPFEWDSPSFEVEEIQPAKSDLEHLSFSVEYKPAVSSPSPQPAPPTNKNRFAAVRNLLNQLDESLPETSPQPTVKSQRNGHIPPPPPKPAKQDRQLPKLAPAIAKTEQSDVPAKNNTLTTKKFNSVIPQAHTKAKVVTSLRKPARPVTKEAVTKPQPENNDQANLGTGEPEMEMIDYHDDWGGHGTESESQLPPDEQPKETTADSEKIDQATGEDTAASAVKTIRVLNDEKAPPPTYPTFNKKKRKPSTH